MAGDIVLEHLGELIAAVGALGTAAFGLVDITKGFWGGMSNAGFSSIQHAIRPLLGEADAAPAIFQPMDAIRTLRANWLNGVAKADQKTAAKKLVLLRIKAGATKDLAEKLAVDATTLDALADTLRKGIAPTTPEGLGMQKRVDDMLGAIVDEAYERGDQRYRNLSKLLACVVAVILAVIAGATLYCRNLPAAPPAGPDAPHWFDFFGTSQFLIAILVGLVSTPLAPIAKDVSSAIGAAAKALGATKPDAPKAP